MDVDQVIRKSREEFVKLGKTPADGITGLTRVEGGWVVSLEAVERRAIPDSLDLLGLYEIRLDDSGNLVSMERKGLRRRGDTKEG